MGYPGDDDKLFPVVDRVDNPVVTNANSKVVTTRKLYGARRARIDRQAVDCWMSFWPTIRLSGAMCAV